MARHGTLRILNPAPRIYALAGDFDLNEVPTFLHTVGAAAAQAGDLLLNLEDLVFLDSTAIAALLRVARQLDGELILFRPTGRVLRVLETVGIRKSGNVRISEDGPAGVAENVSSQP